MAQSLTLVGGAGLATARSEPTVGHRGPGAWSPRSGWELARQSKANLVLIGTEPMASDVIIRLWRDFEGPVAIRRPAERLLLSPTSQPVGTIVLHAIDTLTRQEQHALYHWLSARNGRTWVISTASPSLSEKVHAGTFDDALYYRLNTICVDLSAQPE